jgi:hypothetical protein
MAWAVHLDDGTLFEFDRTIDTFRVWPVRGGSR